jgi:hypothetical protein
LHFLCFVFLHRLDEGSKIASVDSQRVQNLAQAPPTVSVSERDIPTFDGYGKLEIVHSA